MSADHRLGERIRDPTEPDDAGSVGPELDATGLTALIAHPGAELYGSDRVLLESASALVDSGWRVVATVPQRGPLVLELEKRGVQVILCPIPVVRKSALRPRGLLRFGVMTLRGSIAGWRLISRVRPDVVYVNTMTIPLWQLLAWVRRIPILSHVHEGESSAPKLLKLAITFPLFFSTKIVANSRFSQNVLAESFVRLGRRTEIVYNGVAGPVSATPQRSSLDGPLRIVYVGRLSPRKGVDVAIDAISVLASRGVPAHLDLVGAVFTGYEWYEAQLHAQVERLALTHSVRFRGFQPMIWKIVDAGDLVVVPSRSDEPFGDTAVEAILSGRPVIASATSGLLEATAGYSTAVTVRPDDATALAEAIEAMIGGWDESRISMPEDTELARHRHGPDVYKDRITRIFAELVLAHAA